MGVNVTLHIEALVLHGFAPGDRHAIAAGLQDELTRLLSEQGLPRAFEGESNLPRIDGGAIAVNPSSDPRGLGRHVARSILGSLQQ